MHLYGRVVRRLDGSADGKSSMQLRHLTRRADGPNNLIFLVSQLRIISSSSPKYSIGGRAPGTGIDLRSQGIFGGVLVLFIIVAAFVIIRRRRKGGRKSQTSSDGSVLSYWRVRSNNTQADESSQPLNSTTTQGAQRSNRDSAASAVNRNTSIRSIVTLPPYRQSALHTERVLGREGERDGVDVIVDLPTEEDHEAQREDEMEALYQIRQTRRQQIAERDELREPKASGRGPW